MTNYYLTDIFIVNATMVKSIYFYSTALEAYLKQYLQLY